MVHITDKRAQKVLAVH